MSQFALRVTVLAAAISAGGLIYGLPMALAADGRWVDQVANYILVEKDLSREGSFDPYLEQVTAVRNASGKGDWVGTYRGMNQLMAMLDAGVGGISGKTAERIWNYCYEVVPPDMHSDEVHIRAMGKEAYERMKYREERQREISSHSF